MYLCIVKLKQQTIMSQLKKQISVACFGIDAYSLDALNSCNDKQLSEMALADGDNTIIYDSLEQFQKDMNDTAINLWEYNYVFFLDSTTY